MGGHTADAIGYVCLMLIIILFAGEPNLMTAIIQKLGQ